MKKAMPCKRRVIRSSKKGSIREISSLSYGLDSEDEETWRRNSINFFSDTSSENFPNHVWRVLLFDAWTLWKVRSLFQAATIWCLFILFLGLISVSIIGPFNQSKLSQQEILRLGVEEKYMLNVSDVSEENETLIEVSQKNTLKYYWKSENILNNAKENEFENLSYHLLYAKEKELSNQNSQFASPSIIKFSKRKNMSAKEASDPLNFSKNSEKKEITSERLLTETTADITSKLVDLENLIHQISAKIGRLQNDLSPEHKFLEDTKIRKIVHEEVIEVEKVKLGLPDFALESSGGNVIGTPNTKTYASRTLVQLFGFPLWYVESSPRNALQGFHGSEDEMSEILLGEYVYDNNGTPHQTFLIQREVSIPFKVVELRIHSNYGHPEFTCLYRFQVHGRFSVE